MIEIDEAICVGCGMCAADCPRRIIAIRNGKATLVGTTCIECGHCLCICPRNAVSMPGYDMGEVEEVRYSRAALDPATLMRAIKGRRSIRRFRKRTVEREKLLQVVEAGRYTPSGANAQDVEYIVLQERLPEVTQLTLEALRNLAEHRENGSVSPLVARYAARWIEMEREYREEDRDRLFYHAPAVLVITGKDVVNAALAASNAELMAHALGLGCVHVGFFRLAATSLAIRQELGLEHDRDVVCCLALGYPDVDYLRTPPRRRKEVRFL